MNRSTIWSMMTLAMAFLSYCMHRDISANIFLAAVFIIQAVKPQDEAKLNQLAMTFCALVGTTIIGFALCSLAFGLQWNRPSSW